MKDARGKSWENSHDIIPNGEVWTYYAGAQDADLLLRQIHRTQLPVGMTMYDLRLKS